MQQQDNAEQAQGQQGQDQEYEQHRQEFAGQFFGTEAAAVPPAAKVEESTENAPQDKATAAAEGSDQAATEKSVDPFADAPAYVRDMAARLEGQAEQISRLNKQLRSHGGRQGALAESLKKLQGLLSQPAQLDPQQQEDMARLQRDFPELATVLEGRTKALQEDISRRTQAIVDELAAPVAQGAQDAQVDDAIAAGFNALDTAEEFADVRDYRKVFTHPEFMPWVQSLPPSVAQLINSNDPKDAAYMARQFKLVSPAYQQAQQQRQQAEELQAKRGKVLAQNSNPLGKGAQGARQPDESDEAYWKAHYAQKLGLR